MDKPESKIDVLMRLKRIEGQLRGVGRMVEEGVPCTEILNQVAAATAAIKKVGTAIVHSHLEECVEDLLPKFEDRQKRTLREFQKALSRYIDWA